MGTRLTGTKSRLRRGVAVAAGLTAMGALAVVAVNASAASKPTLAQVQSKVNQLTTEFNKVSQQLDRAGEQVAAAQRQLKQVTAKYQHANAQFEAARMVVAQIAAKHQLPFIAVRVIVDTAADVLPRAVVAASTAGRVRFARLIGGLILAPREIASLIRLAQRYRIAMRSLRAIGANLT